MHKIQIYTTPTCSYCAMAKDYFKSKGLEYEAFDVTQDMEKQKEMVKLSGALSVPVIVVDGEVIHGFNKERLDELLAN